ncbi:MAG: hypothetical protein JOZ08_18790 [Verrucomicrobia bacterium]|nr:hypothetical protein [Verrucomicrobiota bacterium]MBV8275359.1 hypothetical protein [Verrucomicrobiota bacterium]
MKEFPFAEVLVLVAVRLGGKQNVDTWLAPLTRASVSGLRGNINFE